MSEMQRLKCVAMIRDCYAKKTQSNPEGEQPVYAAYLELCLKVGQAPS